MINPTPIPIETCLTINDARRDDKLFNRYWFKYPPEWITASNNEKIIGIRSIHILKCMRNLQCLIKVRKYNKLKFREAIASAVAANELVIGDNYDYDNPPINDITKAMKYISDAYKAEIGIFLAINIDFNEHVQKLCSAFNEEFIRKAKEFNANKTVTTKPAFMSMYDLQEYNDVYMREAFDINPVTKETTRCLVFESKLNTDSTRDCYVDISFEDFNNDFKDVLNISYNNNEYGSNYVPLYADHENSTTNERISRYFRGYKFKHIWDRTSCKIFSSLATQSNRNYLCNTNVLFNPIKYFIAKSTDTEFYIDFFSSRAINAPIKLPRGEDFFIELQLQSNRKLLYI